MPGCGCYRVKHRIKAGNITHSFACSLKSSASNSIDPPHAVGPPAVARTVLTLGISYGGSHIAQHPSVVSTFQRRQLCSRRRSEDRCSRVELLRVECLRDAGSLLVRDDCACSRFARHL